MGCPRCFAPLGITVERSSGEDEDSQRCKSSRGRQGILSRIERGGKFRTSTKITAVVKEVKNMMKRDGNSKALIFSQFVDMLDLVEWQLGEVRWKHESSSVKGIPTAKLVGNMSLASRNKVLEAFQSDPAIKVFLISLKAGGEGLNLQAADHVFLLDPWWNPSSELQAIQRAYRIGQVRPVKAVRLLTRGTIEEQIMQLQLRKQMLFDATVSAKNEMAARLTAEDLQFLFRMPG